MAVPGLRDAQVILEAVLSLFLPCADALTRLRIETGGLEPPPAAGALCMQVVARATMKGIPGELAARRLYAESRLGIGDPVNPLRALAKYWCPGGRRKNCDMIEAGLVAMGYYWEKAGGDVRRAECMYHTGGKGCR